MLTRWPTGLTELEALQHHLAALQPAPWVARPTVIGGCFVCFGRGASGPGHTGDLGWVAATAMTGRRLLAAAEATGVAGSPYASGYLAAREGPLLEAAARALPEPPDVFLINATGRDHPRRAGLALHLGWVLEVPTVGVTHRPLIATGETPDPSLDARSPLWIGNEQVGWWLRARSGTRPLAVSPGWRTDIDSVCQIVQTAILHSRTPEPIRQARRLARTARSRAFQAGL